MDGVAYYNEIDSYCVEWLRNLIEAGLIAHGEVDSRSIEDVTPKDLNGFTQCHFFAGIGGWSFALRLAGWPDAEPVWTGSCPCQPFSGIGKGLAFDDPRHLWPYLGKLIEEQKPPVFFGEQVATAKLWLDLVLSDLERYDYACGAANIPACSKGARHERQRLWIAAYSNQEGRQNAEGLAAAQEKAYFGEPIGMAHGKEVGKPNESWIVDGLLGEGNAVSAYGNSIVPQVAAEFIIASSLAMQDLADSREQLAA